jgi:hypothetical protein
MTPGHNLGAQASGSVSVSPGKLLKLEERVQEPCYRHSLRNIRHTIHQDLCILERYYAEDGHVFRGIYSR